MDPQAVGRMELVLRVGHGSRCLHCLSPLGYTWCTHALEGPEDPGGIDVFRGSTGREKQKGPGNDSPANRRKD